MKICPRCKNKSWDDLKQYCYICNTIIKKICPKCADKSLSEGICLNCGYEKTKKTCRDCYWFNPIHFFEDSLGQWYSCLLPKKDKKQGKTRTSTQKDSIACDYFKKEVKNG